MNTALAAILALSAAGPRWDKGPERHLPAVRWHRGVASWYGDEETVTCTGARYNPDGLSCAHRTLPIGTRLEVRYRGRTVRVSVLDRGPFIAGRVLDLSRGAARRLGMLEAGVVTVTWRRLP